MDSTQKTESGNTKGRAKAALRQSSKTENDDTRNQRRLILNERAPFGDALSDIGWIRTKLQERGLLNGPHLLGPQMTPGKGEGGAYDGFSGDVLLSGPSGDDVAGARMQRRNDQTRSLAHRAAMAMMKLPGYSYDRRRALGQLVADYAHPWMREQREAERVERGRREGAGIPRSVEEPATKLGAKALELIDSLTTETKTQAETISKAMSYSLMNDQERLEQAVEENLRLPEKKRLTEREIARRHGVHHSKVQRIVLRETDDT